MTMKQLFILGLLTFVLNRPGFAQGTAFTYQGRLMDAAIPASGSYDLRFILYTADVGGSQVGPILTNSATTVSGGLFTVALDFGGNAFTNASRFLEIAVRTNGGGAFSILTPRQNLTPTPYAVFAENVGSGGLAAGTYPSAVTFNNAGNNFSGSFIGNGSGLTSVNAATVGGVSAANLWRTTGNAGTTAGTHFLGTTDNQPLEFKVNGMRALRLEDNGDGDDPGTARDGAPNLIGGSPGNFVAAGVFGATIGGGGATNFSGSLTNAIRSDYATIAGGNSQDIGPDSPASAIGGGSANGIAAYSGGATIAGGYGNNIGASPGGVIGGGRINEIASSFAAAIAGGEVNAVASDSDYSTIGGGRYNTITNGAKHATIPGGLNNTAGGYSSFAAGHRAKANHQGAFVWADSQDADFASTAANQFNIRALGGVRLSDDTRALSFGSNTRQMINLYDDNYGIGVQSGGTYFRTTTRFSWFQGGTHSDTANSPGAGGALLMTLNSGGLTVNGTFVSASDRNVKENFRPVSPREVLDKVAALPITEWNYKADQGSRHIGPVAQDFHAAFGVGPDNKHIAMVDADGVALAAIQGLNAKLEEKETRIAGLERRLENLERLINRENGGAK